MGTLQPSEIAKFAVVLVFSHIISLNHDRMRSFAVGVLPFVLVLGVVAALMLLEPHLSGTLLILGIGAVLMFVGGTGLRFRQLQRRHLPLGQHHIQIHNNRHTPPHTVRSFSSRISTAAAMTFFTTLTASARNAMIVVMKNRGG